MEDYIKKVEGPNGHKLLADSYEEGLQKIVDKSGHFFYGMRRGAEVAAQSQSLQGLNLHFFPSYFKTSSTILLTKHSPYTRIISKGATFQERDVGHQVTTFFLGLRKLRYNGALGKISEKHR